MENTCIYLYRKCYWIDIGSFVDKILLQFFRPNAIMLNIHEDMCMRRYYRNSPARISNYLPVQLPIMSFKIPAHFLGLSS